MDNKDYFMKFDRPFTIEIDPDAKRQINLDPRGAYGKITMGYDNDWEHFYMSPSVWKIEDYEKQWKLAWKHLETHDTGVFVANVQPNPMATIYSLYKIQDSIFIRPSMLFEESYLEMIGNNPYTPETSFLYIPERKHFFMKFRGKKIPADEWKVKIIS